MPSVFNSCRRFILGLSTTVLSGLIACAPQGSQSAQSCLAKKFSPKVALNSSEFPNEGDINAQTVLAGTPLVVDLLDYCPVPGLLTKQISNRLTGVTKSGQRSYPWQLPNDISLQDLQRLVKDDVCVVQVSRAQVDQLDDHDSQFIFQSDSFIRTTRNRLNEMTSPLSSNATAASIPNDPSANLEKHLTAIGDSLAYDIFFDAKTGIKKEVVIAVIDTGVRIDHEDLKDNLWVNKGEIPNNQIDDDHNGYIDDVYGYNFVSHVASPQPEKTPANAAWIWAHGTRVAGLAAAAGKNGKGGFGANYQAKIMSLNNLGPGSGMDQGVTANAIRYAVDNGASVINLSIGGNSGQIAAYRDALKYAVSKGVVVLAAAGNESSAISTTYSAAGLASSKAGLISIGNFQSQNYNKDTMSNFSTTYVELGAPGINTMSEQLYTTSPESTSSYSYFAGTSAATPVAAGAAALAIGLIESRGYRYTAGDIESLLLDSAKKMPSLSSYFKDGNAIDLANLAVLINKKYPQFSPPKGDLPIGTGGTPSKEPLPPEPADKCLGA